MKLARGLALLMAVALIGTLGTACGKKAATATASDQASSTSTQSQPNPGDMLVGPPEPGTVTTAKPADGNAAGKSTDKSTAPSADKAASGSNTTASGAGTGVGGATGSGGANSAGSATASSGSGGSPSDGSSSGGSPSPAPVTPAGQFELLVTQNFGTSGMFDETVSYASGQSLVDVMRAHLTIETAYGGGFINSINGVKSGYTDKSIFTRKKQDWFYYINGSVATVGVDAYQPHTGDETWWDYHDWSGSGNNTPCVVGEYPHPFTTGYNGVHESAVIYYSGNHAAEANRLAQSLTAQGASHVSTAAYQDGAVANPSSNVIVLGTWSELSEQPAVSQKFGNPTSSGLYASFDNGAVNLLDAKGKPSGKTGQAAILASGSGNGDTTPVWLVIGEDDASLSQAVNAMVNNPGELHHKMGVVLSGGTAVEVPVAP